MCCLTRCFRGQLYTKLKQHESGSLSQQLIVSLVVCPAQRTKDMKIVISSILGHKVLFVFSYDYTYRCIKNFSMTYHISISLILWKDIYLLLMLYIRYLFIINVIKKKKGFSIPPLQRNNKFKGYKYFLNHLSKRLTILII